MFTGLLAERMGFEPTCQELPGNSISSRARYDHFDTSPMVIKPLISISQFAGIFNLFSEKASSAQMFTSFSCRGIMHAERSGAPLPAPVYLKFSGISGRSGKRLFIWRES